MASVALALAIATPAYAQKRTPVRKPAAVAKTPIRPAAKIPARPAPTTRTPSSITRPTGGSLFGGKGQQEVDKPLKVSGQSRNLNMMLILKGEKDKIHFGEIRENYKREIQQTNY